jgi:hypothetical protein
MDNFQFAVSLMSPHMRHHLSIGSLSSRHIIGWCPHHRSDTFPPDRAVPIQFYLSHLFKQDCLLGLRVSSWRGLGRKKQLHGIGNAYIIRFHENNTGFHPLEPESGCPCLPSCYSGFKNVQYNHDQVWTYLYSLQQQKRHMLNKFDNKRQAKVRTFRSRDGMRKVGWHYVCFQVKASVLENTITITQHHIILHPWVMIEFG